MAPSLHQRHVPNCSTTELLLVCTTVVTLVHIPPIPPSSRHQPQHLRASMAALTAGRALLQACKQGAFADVKACTTRLLAVPHAKETNAAMKMAMGETAYSGKANSLGHLITSVPPSHWQGTSGPWEPIVSPPFDSLPTDWLVLRMPDYVVYKAAAGGAPDVMQVLLDAGLGLDHAVERLGSPLGIALLHRKLDLIRFLLTKGADPNNVYQFHPTSLLHQAALGRSPDIMQLLLDYGATMQGSKALLGAAEGGSIEAAALALDSGADVNEVFRWDLLDGDKDVIGSALHVAVKHGHEAMVSFLLRCGAKQELLDGDRATVKALAAKKGNLAVVRLLKQHEPSDSGKLLVDRQ
jgi:hypothetical protein